MGILEEDLEWLVFADSKVAQAIYGGEYATLAGAQTRAREIFGLEERWLRTYVMRDTDEGTLQVFVVDRDGERYEGELHLIDVRSRAYTRSRTSALAERTV
jgi:hypothetical protein